MKFTYDFVKENLKIYKEAKSNLPIINQYEMGEISYQSMQKIGLEKFALFYQFLNELEKKEFNPLAAMSYSELKELLIANTKNERFKTWLKNRSQKQFKKLIEEDPQTFDRLLNGRWITKPGYNFRGRRIYGRRSGESCEGLDTAFIPLINWIISNDIEVGSATTSDTFKNFSLQDKYQGRIKWYTGVQLDINSIPKKEIDITHNLLTSVLDFIGDKKIDFRKLNCDFIIDTFQNKLRELITIPTGTSIRCKFDLKNSAGTNLLLTSNDYIVDNSMISNGFLRVLVVDETGYRSWYDYSNFEDKAIERDLLLSQLGII
jgi:hypothetical protein